MIFIPGYIGERLPTRSARQSQQSCALWARFAALAVLVDVRISIANSSR